MHESRAKNPFVNLQLFKIRRFSFSVISLLIVAMCYSLTGFLLPFYLQDILAYDANTNRYLVHDAVDTHRGAGAVERLPGRPARPADSRHGRGRVFMILSLGHGRACCASIRTG